MKYSWVKPMVQFLAPLVVLAILIVFVILKFAWRKVRYERSRQEVADLLDAFLEGRERPWAWDTFLSFQLKDEELEGIRLRCAKLDAEFPPDEKGRFCSEEGIRVIRGYIGQLRKWGER